MAGIYLHIPYCKTKCPYCDFYSEVHTGKDPDFTRALLKELEIRKDYLPGEQVETVYFGGGTPSQLELKDVVLILDTIFKTYDLVPGAEITFECNPDDVYDGYLTQLRKTGFNRLSLGLQSFHDDELKLLGRRHSASQNRYVLNRATKEGFDNISIDLIYGLPGSTPERWKNTLKHIFQYSFHHLSAYHLTIEPATVFGEKLNKGELQEISEENSLKQFRFLMDFARQNQFEHYELSNFCLPGYYSRHNSSYWKQVPYLGVGPSAHSYNGLTRQWNVANNRLYKESLLQGSLPAKKEILTKNDLFNEYVITRMRTQWGVDLESIRRQFGREYRDYLLQQAKTSINHGYIVQNGHNLVLSDEGKFISDTIFRELMWTEDE